MCAFFGPKNGDFQKMLRIVWNGEKCNKIKKKLFLGGIVLWYWIVSFLVLNILGIINKNNTIMLRSLAVRLYLVSANICNHDPINIVGDLLPRLNRLFPANGFRWLRWPLQFSFMTPVKSVYLKFKIGSNHLCHLLFLCLNFTSPRPNSQQSALVLAASWWKIQGFLG